MTVENIYAYCLVRTDLPSLGPGKAVAHAMHAGNQLTWREVVLPMKEGKPPSPEVVAWHELASGFGTTIALGDKNQIDISTLNQVVDAAKKLGFVADLVVDPTYPYLVDREVYNLIDPSVHTLPAVTAGNGMMCCFRMEVSCGYVLGDKSSLRVLLKSFGLYPND